MADLVISPADVVPASTSKMQTGLAGAAINAGQAVYVDAQDGGKIKLADKTAAATAGSVGIAISTADVAGQPVSYLPANGGDLAVGAVAAAGETYVLSTAGAVSPESDLVATDFVTYLGYGKDSNTISLMVKATGIQHA